MSFDPVTFEKIQEEINESLKQFVGERATVGVADTIKAALVAKLRNIYNKYEINKPLPRVEVQIHLSDVFVRLYDPRTNREITLAKLLDS